HTSGVGANAIALDHTVVGGQFLYACTELEGIFVIR
ncbi:MAG: hypothetical protein RIQ53_3323, partial [Pseudomonadota bacterium]